MIKAYTSVNGPETVLPIGVEFAPDPTFLITDVLGITSIDLSASLIPPNATGGITYSFYPESVTNVTQNGNVAHVTAVSVYSNKKIYRIIIKY